MNFDVGSVVKYHNKIVRVVKKTDDHIMVAPYFADGNMGNLLYSVPTSNTASIQIGEVATKDYLKNQLKSIAEDKSEESDEYFAKVDRAFSQFSLEQAVEGIKILVDHKIAEKQNFTANKMSKLKELNMIVLTEICAVFQLDMKDAMTLLTKSIKHRETAAA